ncbi:MAG TPA: hypothetical protein DGC56_03455, partial [Alistipes putredinis]|nr:hypothetical protein [Alistipes putredinis]
FKIREDSMIESSLILCPVRNPLKPDRPDLSPPTYSQKTGSSALVKQIKKQTQGKNLASAPDIDI